MLVENPNDLRHLRFDTGEAFVRLAFVLRLKAVGFRHASDKCRLVGVKCRLVLDERGQGFFKPIMAVRGWSFSCQRSSPLALSERAAIRFVNRGDRIRTCDFVVPNHAL